MPNRYKFILIGQIGAGKTTLFNLIEGGGEAALKTQALSFGSAGIDTPGEYLAHPRMYHALITTSADVDHLIYVHAANDLCSILPPGFFDIYGPKKIDAVITKIDASDADVNKVKRLLEVGNFKGRVFEVSKDDEKSVDEFKFYLNGHQLAEEIK